MTGAAHRAPRSPERRVGLLTAAVDATMFAVALALTIAVWHDVESLWRQYAALGFLLTGPGWGIMRLQGEHLSARTALWSIGASIAVVAVTGHVVVTVLGWTWRPVFYWLAALAGIAPTLRRLARREPLRAPAEALR